MLRIIFLLIFFVLYPLNHAYSQQRELIKISDKVGKVIDINDRDYYQLWPDFDNFSGAKLFKQDSTLKLIIFYSEAGKPYSRSYNYSENQIAELKGWIENFEDIRKNNFNKKISQLYEPSYSSPDKENLIAGKDWSDPEKERINVKIETIYDKTYRGLLWDFVDKNNILILDKTNWDTLKINRITKFQVEKETSFIEPTLWGALGGTLFGAAIALKAGPGMGVGFIPIIGTILGAPVGFVYGILKGIDPEYNFRKYTEPERMKIIIKYLPK